MKEAKSTLSPLELWQKYSVPSPHEDAKKYRNPYSAIMVDYAQQAGRELQTILAAPDAKVVIGGSLGYGAAIHGGYDIDLRLLFPPSEDAKNRLEKASATLHAVAGFDAGKIVGAARNIYHHYKQVKIDGLPADADAYLTLNIMLQSEYEGMADVAKLLPEVVVDRLVVAKGLSGLEGEDEYEMVKGHWKSFLKWLFANRYRDATPAERPGILAQAQLSYPLFLKGREEK